MAKDIKNLSIGYVGSLAEQDKQYYVDEHIYITMNAHDFGFRFLKSGQPYRVEEGRVLIVTHGQAHVFINLEEHTLTEGSVTVLVPDAIFEIVEWSEDFDLKAFTFKNLPIFTTLDQQVSMTLDSDEWQLANEYFNLLWHEVKRQPLLVETITYLQTAFLLELRRISNREKSIRQKTESRQEAQFHRFLALVTQHGLHERKIEFYADKMCVTPNHLGAVIKQVSGLTIMQWLNKHAIQKAKVMLKYSDLPVWEISERMNFANPSFFSKFFKSEVGMTPGEYRKL